ncbi:unnamed protein product [Hydatigera taeniaeformis]|uniref:Secreted protein n=1 Tax=Hydatigena taeniaeformis TaxID=6205 RepID=A0A0R3XAZ7_HYDTA|nr:unnamed protein product [Hydatigera taeniaeformis]
MSNRAYVVLFVAPRISQSNAHSHHHRHSEVHVQCAALPRLWEHSAAACAARCARTCIHPHVCTHVRTYDDVVKSLLISAECASGFVPTLQDDSCTPFMEGLMRHRVRHGQGGDANGRWAPGQPPSDSLE